MQAVIEYLTRICIHTSDRTTNMPNKSICYCASTAVEVLNIESLTRNATYVAVNRMEVEQMVYILTFFQEGARMNAKPIFPLSLFLSV